MVNILGDIQLITLHRSLTSLMNGLKTGAKPYFSRFVDVTQAIN